MKRNAKITVVSRQYIDGDINKNEFSADGEIEIDAASCTLKYREDLGEGSVSDCEINSIIGRLTIVRKGAINNTLEIIPEKSVDSVYGTVMGEFSVKVTGRQIKVKHSENKTEITAYYYLDFGSTGNVLNKVTITANYGDIINE